MPYAKDNICVCSSGSDNSKANSKRLETGFIFFFIDFIRHFFNAVDLAQLSTICTHVCTG